MKRFQFKFETLENVRKAQEGKCLRDLSVAQSKFRESVEFKQNLVAELDAALLRREVLAQMAVSVDRYLVENDFIVGTKIRLVQADQGIVRARRMVEKALRAYLMARRQTRVIEMLREKAFAEFKKERSRKETRALDELYTMRHQLAEKMGGAA